MRLLALLSVTAMALAQSPPTTTTGAVEGSALDAATGSPIRKAKITFRFKRQDVRIVTTAADGRFQALNLVPGDYRITAVARGYLPLDNETSVGPRRAVMAFALAGGQKVSGIVLRLTPAAAVSGRIVDEDDEPIGGVPVQLWSIRYRDGRRELASLNDARALTDDRGMYRIAGIAPGRYYVSAFHLQAFGAPVAAADDLRYFRTFYPGAADPVAANTIQLAPGAELENINWKAAKVQTVRVSGRVSGDPTRYFANLVPDGILSPNDAHLVAKIRTNGDFEFQGVPPGNHTLFVGGGDEAWAIRTIVAGRSGVDGLTINLSPQIRVEGHVRLEGDSKAHVPIACRADTAVSGPL